VSTKMAVFWVVAPCSLVDRPDDGGSKDLWNVDKLLPDYTALQPRRRHLQAFGCLDYTSWKHDKVWVNTSWNNRKFTKYISCWLLVTFHLLIYAYCCFQ
jgi:hypothetical protein